MKSTKVISICRNITHQMESEIRWLRIKAKLRAFMYRKIIRELLARKNGSRCKNSCSIEKSKGIFKAEISTRKDIHLVECLFVHIAVRVYDADMFTVKEWNGYVQHISKKEKRPVREFVLEKSYLRALDAKGEVLLTILSSLAQDESRSISENCTWGIRRRFEQGKHKMSTKRFLGYDTDEDGHLVVNPQQAKIVIRLYEEFLSGKTVDYIARIFKAEKLKSWDGKYNWQASTLDSMLRNEKYMGDAILQKSYTADFLSKRRVQNGGEIQMYVTDETFTKLFVMSWNEITEDPEDYQEKWEANIKSDDVLLRYKTRLLMKHAAAGPIKEFDPELMMAVMDHITVFEDGRLQIKFYNGIEFEVETE